jgi:hypothetical protein
MSQTTTTERVITLSFDEQKVYENVKKRFKAEGTPINDETIEMLLNDADEFPERVLEESIYVSVHNLFPKKEGLSFGKAIEALKNGERVQRKGWNGKGLFVFMQVPASIQIPIVPQMQSLPQSVKDVFKQRIDAETKNGTMMPNINSKAVSIRYSNQLALVNIDNEISGWSPSSTDTLAEDWTILD